MLKTPAGEVWQLQILTLTCLLVDLKAAHLVNNESTRHAQTGFWPKAVCDHDSEAGLWEAVVWRTGVHHLVHHHD